jgi:hypothetical protein
MSQQCSADYCTPKMSDGRLLGDEPWRPRCAQQYRDMMGGKFTSSYDYRTYLTENATKIMEQNALEAYTRTACGPCVEPWDQGTMLPEQTMQQCDARKCTFRVTDPFGLGFGRKYYADEQDAEAKAAFIAAKEKQNAYFKNLADKCTPPKEDMLYYPIEGGPYKEYVRPSIPSGAKIM